MGRVCILAQSVPAVLMGMFRRPDTCSDFGLDWWGGGGFRNSTPLKTQTGASRHPPGGKGRRQAWSSSFFVLVCSLCPGAGSVQLYGAAVLLGFFSSIILLT